MTGWHSCIKNKQLLMRKLTGFWVSIKSKSGHWWETDKFWRLLSPYVTTVLGRFSIPPCSSGQEGVVCIVPTGLPWEDSASVYHFDFLLPAPSPRHPSPPPPPSMDQLPFKSAFKASHWGCSYLVIYTHMCICLLLSWLSLCVSAAGFKHASATFSLFGQFFLHTFF